jgi:hypothetical protein
LVSIRLSESCDGWVGDQAGRMMTGDFSVARKNADSGSMEP